MCIQRMQKMLAFHCDCLGMILNYMSNCRISFFNCPAGFSIKSWKKNLNLYNMKNRSTDLSKFRIQKGKSC